AKILLRAAEDLRLEGTEQALAILRDRAEMRPAPRNILQQMELAMIGRAEVQEVPVLNALKSRENRAQCVRSLRSPEASRILQNGSITNLAFFAPVSSAAGFPLESAILTTAFLIDQGAFGANVRTEPTLKDDIIKISALGSVANHSAALE